MGWSGSTYDVVASPQARWGDDVVERLRGALPGQRPVRVLDAGCGSGRVTEILLERAPEAAVVAGDISSSMREAAERRLRRFGDRVEVVELDLDRDPLTPSPSDPFDAILSTGTIHWIDDHPGMYRRLAEVLAPGGALVAQGGGEGSIEEVRAILDDLGVEWRTFNRYAGAAESEGWLRDAGFVSVWTWMSTEYVGFEVVDDLVEYLAGGALAPYLSELPEDQRTGIVEQVVDRLGSLELRFVRLNVLARLPEET